MPSCCRKNQNPAEISTAGRTNSLNQYTSVGDAAYTYDYRGWRISRTIYGAPDVTIRYAYDGDQILAEYDGSGTLLRKFVYSPGVDEPICLIDAGNGDAACYYHFDGLGSVVALWRSRGMPYLFRPPD